MMILLKRELIKIAGKDAFALLQNLITNDLNKLANQPLIYACLLNPKGRFIADFFIFQTAPEKFYLDCHQNDSSQILKLLSFYQLKQELTIEKIAANIIFSQSSKPHNLPSQTLLSAPDHRFKEVYYRHYYQTALAINDQSLSDETAYDLLAIKNGLADGYRDLTRERSIILEFGLADMAVDFNKGCYLGQELIARTQYLGTIRKAIISLEIATDFKLPKTCSIINHQQIEIGQLTSAIISGEKNYAQALVKKDQIKTGQIYVKHDQKSYLAQFFTG